VKHVVIIGAGFAGLNAAKRLRNSSDIEVTVIDRENHHLFQPLLYQVAMAALSPADIAVPIRTLLVAPNIRVIKATAQRIDVERRCVITDAGEYLWVWASANCSEFGTNLACFFKARLCLIR
jgi:NADH dehydrogenase